MTPLSSADLRALVEMREAGTADYAVRFDPRDMAFVVYCAADDLTVACFADDEQGKRDADLVAASVNALVPLVREVEALRAKLSLVAHLDECSTCGHARARHIDRADVMTREPCDEDGCKCVEFGSCWDEVIRLRAKLAAAEAKCGVKLSIARSAVIDLLRHCGIEPDGIMTFDEDTLAIKRYVDGLRASMEAALSARDGALRSAAQRLYDWYAEDHDGTPASWRTHDALTRWAALKDALSPPPSEPVVSVRVHACGDMTASKCNCSICDVNECEVCAVGPPSETK